MVSKGVIAHVSWLTKWVSSLTYSHKPDGTLCICLDPKDINKAIVWEHYKAPTLDEISHELSGTTCFIKLDATDGFWNIPLDEKSSYLTNFNTHCGRYRFLHMPFGLKMPQDIFEMQMDHLPGIIMIHDDICIYGHTPEKHDWHLVQLIKTAKQDSIVFNSSKCHIRQPQIAFYGTVFTMQGMWLDPSKIQALQDLPTPNSQANLQSFLGLINYLQPIIPGLSDNSVLWEQPIKGDWNPSTDTAFQHLKACICQTLLNTVLMYYD